MCDSQLAQHVSTQRRMLWEIVQQAFAASNCLRVVSSKDLLSGKVKQFIGLGRAGGYLFLLFGLLCFFLHLCNCSASIMDGIADYALPFRQIPLSLLGEGCKYTRILNPFGIDWQ